MDYYGDSGYGAPRRTSSSFSRFAIPGWILIVLGVVLLVLGFVDVGWTASRYGVGCDEIATTYYDPCDANHIYTYISTPIWGGLIIAGAGLVSVMMTPKRLSKDTGVVYYIYVGMSLLVCVIISPAIIVLNALELILNNEKFYNNDVQGTIATMDEVKFALPMVLAILGGISFFVSVTAAMIGCFCRPITRRYTREVLDYVTRVPREPVYAESPRYATRTSYAPRTRDYYSVDRTRPRSEVVERIVERPAYRSIHDEYSDYGDYRTRDYGDYYDYRPARSLRALRY